MSDRFKDIVNNLNPDYCYIVFEKTFSADDNSMPDEAGSFLGDLEKDALTIDIEKDADCNRFWVIACFDPEKSDLIMDRFQILKLSKSDRVVFYGTRPKNRF